MDEFGLTQLPQLLIARDRGMPLVALGSLVPHPTAAMIWLKKSNIHEIRDLKGKTIAIPGLLFQKALLRAILRKGGLNLEDVKVKTVGYALVSALTSGQADAIFGGTWNIEGAALKARGVNPVVKQVQELGVPDYDELIVITRSDMVAKDPELVRDVMATVSGGVAAVRSKPAAAVKLIEETSESSPEIGRKETEAAMTATLPLLSSSYRLDPNRASRLAAWMHREGLIRREPRPSEFLTNAYLPDR